MSVVTGKFRVGDIVDWNDYQKTKSCAFGSEEFSKLGQGPFEVINVEHMNGIFMVDIKNTITQVMGKGWGEPHFTLKRRKMDKAFDEIKHVLGR